MVKKKIVKLAINEATTTGLDKEPPPSPQAENTENPSFGRRLWNGVKWVGHGIHDFARSSFGQFATNLVGNAIGAQFGAPIAGTIASEVMTGYTLLTNETEESRRKGLEKLVKIYKNPAGSIETTDQTVQKPGDLSTSVKNPVDEPIPVGPAVLKIKRERVRRGPLPQPAPPVNILGEAEESIADRVMARRRGNLPSINLNPEGIQTVPPPPPSQSRVNII
jgi:hypothetical protein